MCKTYVSKNHLPPVISTHATFQAVVLYDPPANTDCKPI